jgi:hypothetical protein
MYNWIFPAMIGQHSLCKTIKKFLSQALWLTPEVLAPWEIEIGRIEVQDQPQQKVSKSPSQPLKI